MIAELKPLVWLPSSVGTKVRMGFNRNSEVVDGSNITISLLDELAIEPGPLKEKIYTIYASGVEDYEGRVFSPKQLISMLIHRNPYKPGDLCHWTGGIRTDTGIIYGPRFPQKKYLFESLCDTLDIWDPKKFRSIPTNYIQELRDKSTSKKADNFSDAELSIYLVAGYAQFIYLIIHPFWNRNGRTSEELMVLFSSSNSSRRHVFYESSRYNVGSATRMELINGMAREMVAEILKELGVGDINQSETQGYSKLISQEGTPIQKSIANNVGPYLYRFAESLVGKSALNKYFCLLEKKLSEMITDTLPERFVHLVGNPYAIKLLNHYIEYGHKPE